MYVHDIDCPLLGDDWITQKDEIPNNNTFIWTPFIRSKVCILKNYITKHKIPNHSKCLLEKGHNWSTARLLLNRTEDVYSSIHLQCILKRNLMCNVVNVTGITIPKDSGNRYVQQENTTERESTFMTLSTEAEGQRVSTNAESTFISELNTTDATFLFEKSVFPLQIGTVNLLTIYC
ncbi:unnamed protein product [Mytilus coruscus]|uniref:Uncharacterized protein n=1 Tax=Mytilus coruscus TaxID=42192 RepID=A0A6J8C610_MYTCO|nr:unnamed protein product [Mytilus coruscus]